MKLSLLLMAMPIAIYAQDSIVVRTAADGYPDPYSSGSANVKKFDNDSRFFRDWSLSIGGGTALLQSSDLTSYYDKKMNWGWNAYASLDKQISHTFGMSLQYQMGHTNQKGKLAWLAQPATADTEYTQVALLGDVNLSNIMRRVDNRSFFRWALHAYGGIGLQSFKTHMTDPNGAFKANGISFNYTKYPFDFEQKLRLDSFFYQIGSGLQYNINKFIDIEGRVMYIITGDETFDGGGMRSQVEPYNQIHRSTSDNFVTVNLGLSFKLGKHDTHLRWYDPLQNTYARVAELENRNVDFTVCEKGDNDNDGVCDDWDRQLDTPAGARVDGAGVALDMDLDGVIDLYDKCVTVPGLVENNGCPTVATIEPTTIETINKDFEGIEFELNSDKIRTKSFGKLNHAADVIKTLGTSNTFAVIGATDTRGSEQYNQNLSQRRADAVVRYLTQQGVSSSVLVAEGHGEKDLKYPECEPATKCPEWKNEANRRVYFKQK